MIFYDFFTNYHKTKQLQNLWGKKPCTYLMILRYVHVETNKYIAGLMPI